MLAFPVRYLVSNTDDATTNPFPNSTASDLSEAGTTSNGFACNTSTYEDVADKFTAGFLE
jgi:hypothetical protein